MMKKLLFIACVFIIPSLIFATTVGGASGKDVYAKPVESKKQDGKTLFRNISIMFFAAGLSANMVSLYQAKSADNFFQNDYMHETNPVLIEENYDKYQDWTDRNRTGLYTSFGLYGAGVAFLIISLAVKDKKAQVFLPKPVQFESDVSGKKLALAWDVRF